MNGYVLAGYLSTIGSISLYALRLIARKRKLIKALKLSQGSKLNK